MSNEKSTTSIATRILAERGGDIATRILAVRSGDAALRNQLIQEYQPFVLKRVADAIGRYVQTENDDAYVTGLIAFNEAIDSYDPLSGPFLPFAALKIRQRLIDLQRREAKHQGHEAIEDHEVAVCSAEQLDLRLELEAFIKSLKAFGITLDMLMAAAPQHRETRLEVTDLGRSVADHPPIRTTLYRTRKLPMQEIALAFMASLKRIKRFRVYLIAVVVICHEQYDMVAQYMAKR